MVDSEPAERLNLLRRVGHSVQRRIAPRDVSIVSDDCWAGQYYRRMGIPYLTPTVGCWAEPVGYLDFVIEMLSGRNFPSIQAEYAIGEKYPILSVGPARFHFIHDTDVAMAVKTFERRLARVNPDKLFVKIDFGKMYTREDVLQWNRLACPNAVALFPLGTPLFSNLEIYNGVGITGWSFNGAKMFGVSEEHFDVVRWLKTGNVERTGTYAAFERVFLRRNNQKQSHSG